jgi:lactoylglutathione lyase
MKFGYTIIYVPDVAASLQFFETAFGFKQRFLHDSGDYGELETGETTLAFAHHSLGHTNLPQGYIAADTAPHPLGIEIAFVTPEIATAHLSAIAAGAIELKPPQPKPWGQLVSYLRAPDGTLIELCTPMG